MCVIVACKMKLPNGEYEIVLIKNRDRNYVASVNFHKRKVGSTKYSVFVDKDTSWSEGINNRGLCMVSSSLMIIDDEQEFHAVDQQGTVSNVGDTFKEALKKTNIVKAVNHIVEKNVMGFTFVTDGKELYIIESARERKEVKSIDGKVILKKEKGKDSKPEEEVIKHSCQWYKVSDEEFDENGYIVRTNHGEYFDETGYDIDTDDGKSTRSRKEETEKAFAKFKPNTIEGIFKCMSVEPHKDSRMNPIRRKGKSDLFTTGQYIMVPSEKNIYYKPISCNVTIDNEKVKLEKDEYITININDGLVESFRSYLNLNIMI
jgi:hypothetical protein